MWLIKTLAAVAIGAALATSAFAQSAKVFVPIDTIVVEPAK